MKVNKENVKKLLKNKFFYLGIFGFIFLIIIIMTFSGGKKPDESECANGKIKDAEGACDANGDNKTSICRENCEANTNNKPVWDCITKKCKCRDGYTECGSLGYCCPEGNCNDGFCCSPDKIIIDPVSHNKKCCAGGTTPDTPTKTKCVAVCGSDTNICEGNDKCFRVSNPTGEDISQITSDNIGKSVQGDDGNMYFCTDRNSSKYEFTNYYPNAIKDNHFCADFNGDGEKYGFCKNKETSTKNPACISKTTPEDCNSDDICDWVSILESKNISKDWDLYLQEMNYKEPDFVAKHCGTSGSRIVNLAYPASTKPTYTDCFLRATTPNTTYVSYDNGTCISLQSCVTPNNIKTSNKNVRSIQEQKPINSDGTIDWISLSTDLPDEHKDPTSKLNTNNKQIDDAWKFEVCGTESCSKINGLGQNYICNNDTGYITNKKSDSYKCQNYKCVLCESGDVSCPFNESKCNDSCNDAPDDALQYNRIYSKMYISTYLGGGDVFYNNGIFKVGMQLGEAGLACNSFKFYKCDPPFDAYIKYKDAFYILYENYTNSGIDSYWTSTLNSNISATLDITKAGKYQFNKESTMINDTYVTINDLSRLLNVETETLLYLSTYTTSNNECGCNKSWDGYGLKCGKYQLYDKVFWINNNIHADGATEIKFQPKI